MRHGYWFLVLINVSFYVSRLTKCFIVSLPDSISGRLILVSPCHQDFEFMKHALYCSLLWTHFIKLVCPIQAEYEK